MALHFLHRLEVEDDAVLSNKVTSANSGFLVVAERLHVMLFESQIQHNAFYIYI